MSNLTTSTTTTAGTGGTDHDFDGSRDMIDGIDTQIIRLVQRRRVISQAIGAAKIELGIPRVDIARERAIFGAYREGLGPRGPHLASHILNYCKES